MPATAPSNLEKAAILLRRLPAHSLNKVLELVGTERAVTLRAALAAVAKRPDLNELEEQILREFREMQREVQESIRGSSSLESLHNGTIPGFESVSLETNSNEPIVDPIGELTKCPPEVLAAVLKQETLRSTALVLRELPPDFTSSVLEKMPADRRHQVFMLLAFKSTVHPDITQKVLQAVALACRSVDLSAPAPTEQELRFKILIGILQKVEREERMRLMESLTEQDEELATQIDDNLYDYTDLLRIQDRSVQKLLTQLELKVVAMALKTAPQEIVDKVMANLSERVRATLTEEMELLSSFPPAKVDEARKEIANVIRLQDKDGTLQWMQ